MTDRRGTTREASVITACRHHGGGPYRAGYLIEKSLSVDNIFVFALLLSYFAFVFRVVTESLREAKPRPSYGLIPEVGGRRPVPVAAWGR